MASERANTMRVGLATHGKETLVEATRPRIRNHLLKHEPW
jgi:hypothetical protein